MKKRSKKSTRRRHATGLFLGILLSLSAVFIVFRFIPVPTTAFMLQSPVNPVKYRWVPMERISPWAGLAVVAAEDQRFPDHWGLDLEAIWSAAQRNWRNRHHDHRVGGSTITQQLAKNLFLWPGGGYFRKLIEAPLALMLELLWGKARILEVYLNVVEFGPGIYGVEAAAQRYFGRPASKLSRFQAARLAAVLPSPRNRHPSRLSLDHWRRVAWIEEQMQQLGLDYVRDL